ncbi:MAG: hydantoinase/oxoprolinase family protein [Ignisphaera sp.]|nr:hypothetical protein [Ignisphaera sp.]MDW8086048.1 hydantoinase/oxoprolinase family protein [Ignisphaera sp.]
MIIIGFDIGGANIKAVKIGVYDNQLTILHTIREYFPVWIRGKKGLEEKLRKLKRVVIGEGAEQYRVAICMTAELSDTYRIKREGVEHVVKASMDAFSDAMDIGFVSYEMKLVTGYEAVRNYTKIAGANWAASAWLLERNSYRWGIENSVFVDVGSTTTTIIPIVSGRVYVRGFTDVEKLIVGELVYTGVLRSNVVGIVNSVPIKGFYARVCNERFALVGDVHLVLGNISSDSYTTETADGRGTSVYEAAERLSRIVCGDVELLNSFEIREIARYIYEMQIATVFSALMQIRSYIASLGIDPSSFTVVSAGIGGFLVGEAAKRAGFKTVVDVDSLAGPGVSAVLPAYAAAVMMYQEGVDSYEVGS